MACRSNGSYWLLSVLEGDASTSAPATAVQTYRLKVTLIDSKPPIWRRFEVPADISLERFHAVLQVVMGWTNSHLHAFDKDGTIYGTYDSESGIECVDERSHRVVLEAVVEADGRAARVLEGHRACPPEDIGGIGGYETFLEAIANRKHRRHKELMSWSGGGFDPEAYDVAGANARLARLKLSRKPSGPMNHGRLVH